MNGKKTKYVTKGKVARNLFSFPRSLTITTIFNANLLITDYRLQIWTRQKNTSNSSCGGIAWG
ncbi:MAG: hypothetical protein ACKPKT_09685, partial [Dolichospermum sp.]